MVLIVVVLLICSAAFVLAIRFYLVTVTKLEIPLSDKDSGKVMTLWLLLSIVMIGTFAIPSLVIEHLGDPVPRPVCILPLLVGAFFSAFVHRQEWKKFLSRFSSRGARGE